MAASVINTHGKQIAVKAGGELTDATRDLVFSRHKPFCSSTYFIYNAAERQTEPFRRNWGGEKERLIWSKRKTRRKENWKRDRAWPASKLAPDEILFCHLSRVYFQWVYVNRTQRIRIRTWPYVIRWVMYSHKSMFLIAFGCIAREVTEHRVYVCSLSFDILCGRCTTAS